MTTAGQSLLRRRPAGPGRIDAASWAKALLRGRVDDPAWARPALLALLAATGLLYLVDLAASGWANAFYTAAVQASTKSWKAFFFGSFDSSNFITVDKPPASLWVMDISARLFGVNSWSILVPQALAGVASVALLYAAVKRWFGAAAGLLAGGILALTPIAVLIFRFNNPDALLTLLLIGAGYAATRAVERGRTSWLILAASLIGLGFLTKMLQALIVVPGFALVYLLASPTPLRRRVIQLLGAGAALVVSAGWWVAIVALWPASSRPYIGGSQNNSILNLIFGYNGFGRLTGNESGSVGGGGAAGQPGRWGPTGIGRMFGSEMGTQISWLLPAALLFLVVALWLGRRAPRTDVRRAAVLGWGSWLVVTGIVFSFAQGIIHPYYTVALAPAIGALVGIGATWAWKQRELLMSRLALAIATAVSSLWAYHLLEQTPTWLPWLRYVVLVSGLGAAAMLAVLPMLQRAFGRIAPLVAVLAVVSLLAAPAAYSLQTASTPHTGALPTAGPAGSSTQGGRGGFGRGNGGGRFGGRPGFGGGFAPPAGGFAPPTVGARFGGGGRGGGGFSGLLNASTPSSALVALLRQNASRYTWVAATVRANSAAGVQLATGEPVMAIGGFNGTDPAPTLAQFQQDVAAGKIHYFIAGGSGSIATWVAAHFTARTVGGMTVYDLTSPTS
ncbi:MAG: glycosyl transferase [Actinomycetia bacterium]|nr:glycosyl transferase [Actinomycetes bacterium]